MLMIFNSLTYMNILCPLNYLPIDEHIHLNMNISHDLSKYLDRKRFWKIYQDNPSMLHIISCLGRQGFNLLQKQKYPSVWKNTYIHSSPINSQAFKYLPLPNTKCWAPKWHAKKQELTLCGCLLSVLSMTLLQAFKSLVK